MKILLPIFVLLAACGGDPTAPFIGIWKNTGGSTTTTCPGNTPQTSTIASNTVTISISKNASTAVVLAFADTNGVACNLTASVVSDTTAQLTAGLSCAVGGGTLTINSGTYVIGAGVTGELTMNTTATATGTTCTQTFDIPFIH